MNTASLHSPCLCNTCTLHHHIFIHIYLLRLFLLSFSPCSIFIKGEDWEFSQESKSVTSKVLRILDLMCTMVAWLSVCITSGKAITTPQFLHRDRKKVLCALIPFMLSIVYLILTIYTHSLHPTDILMILVLVLALFGMLRPKKKDILSFCFVPFEEEESTDVLNAA